MRPSSRLVLDPVVVYQDRRARERARWLFEDVNREVWSSTEYESMQSGGAQDAKPAPSVPGKWSKIRNFMRPAWLTTGESEQDLAEDKALRLVAQVADNYPRLLIWLTEGRISSYWNVFGTWIAVAQVVPGLNWVLWRVVFRPIAYRAPWRMALHELILQEKRRAFNKSLGKERLATRIATTWSTQGLSAVTDVTLIAQTGSRKELRKIIETMSSGCVGVTGLRGSGKTTLIRDFCSHRFGTPLFSPGGLTELPGLRFTVQAPLAYDVREFLVHQYTCLCEAVLADARLNPTSFTDRVILSLIAPRSVRPAALLRGLSGVVLLALAGILAFRTDTGTWPHPHWLLPAVEWAAVSAAFIAALVLTAWRTRNALIEARQVQALAIDAQDRLQKLHFQRTDTRSLGGAVGGPMASNLNLSITQSLTEQMMTLPELVADYRDFAERVVAALQEKRDGNNGRKRPRGSAEDSADIRLVVGIDEIDQIGDIHDVDRFLAGLSSVFGTPNCVYLIAIPPGVLAAGDQRMVPLKTASNGAFDEIVWVESLDLPTAGDLLDRRVAGLPAAFVALCYVLSAGLPRDLLRIARGIFAKGSKTETELAVAAERIIGDELRGLEHRVITHAAALDIPAAAALLGLLDTVIGLGEGSRETSLRAGDIRGVMDNLSCLWAGAARQQFAGTAEQVDPLTTEVCDSFLAGLYFLLTVYELFTAESVPAPVVQLAARMTEKGCELNDNASLRNLARARAALGVNPYLAATIISETRAAHPALFAEIEPAFLGQPGITASEFGSTADLKAALRDMAEQRSQETG